MITYNKECVCFSLFLSLYIIIYSHIYIIICIYIHMRMLYLRRAPEPADGTSSACHCL